MNIQPTKGMDKLTSWVINAAEMIFSGAHAAPEAGAKGLNTIPSRHRLYNAAGGIGLWIVGRHIMNVLVGETPQGKKVDKEKLPEPLQKLHGILAYNRYADDSHNQWMRVMDDLTPAIIGSVGAILGSQIFFSAKEKVMCDAVKWGTKHTNLAEMLADKEIPTLAKDTFKSLQQAKTWRILSGIAGVFGASSGMALLAAPVNILNYGVSLNNAFSLANSSVPGALFLNNKALSWIYNTHSATSRMPALAARGIATNVSNCVSEMMAMEKIVTAEGVTAENAGRVGALSDAIVHHLFPKVTAKGAARFQKEVMKTIENAVKAKAHDPKEVAKHVKGALEKLLIEGRGLDDTIAALSKEIGKENFGELVLANNGFAGWIGNHRKTALGISGAALLSVDAIGEATKKDSQHEALREVGGQTREDIGKPGTTLPTPAPVPEPPAASQPGFVDGPLLNAGRWLSDSVVNVPPQNRLFSALGLTGGLWAGYRGMRAFTGKDYNGAELAKDAKVGVGFRWMADALHSAGIKLDFDYFVNTPDNRLKRAVFWMVPTITGLVGVYMGSKYAFRDYYKKLEHPEYLEDYTAKIAMTQGDKWGWLSATAAMMASPSGISNLPIPGLNYSIGLSTRSVLSYDKKTTMPGMKWWSGNKSDYYFGTKGALQYTIEYAVRNPSEYPKELAALAKATLEPLFPDVTAEQVAEYVNKIQAIRHHHWQEGVGVPKDEQEATRKELKAILRGAGFEKTLGEIGLDPGKAVFQNGAAGKIANAIGAEAEVLKLADEYRHKYAERKRAVPVPNATEGDLQPLALEPALASPVVATSTLTASPEASPPAKAKSFTTNSSVEMGATVRSNTLDKITQKVQPALDWRDSALRQKDMAKATALS